MAACDYCCDGIINFCHMCDTREGHDLHWEYMRLWHLEGLTPCEYDWPTYEWIRKSRDWVDMMNQITHRHVEIQVEP